MCGIYSLLSLFVFLPSDEMVHAKEYCMMCIKRDARQTLQSAVNFQTCMGFSCGHCGICSTESNPVYFNDCLHSGKGEMAKFLIGHRCGRRLVDIWHSEPWYVSMLYTELCAELTLGKFPTSRSMLMLHLPQGMTLHHCRTYLWTVRHWIQSRLHGTGDEARPLDRIQEHIDNLTTQFDAISILMDVTVDHLN